MPRWQLRWLIGLTALLVLGGAPQNAPAKSTPVTQDVWATFVIIEGNGLDPLRPAVYENTVVYATDNYDTLLFKRVTVHDLTTGDVRVLAQELPGVSAVDIYGDWLVSWHPTYFYHSIHAFNLATDEHRVLEPGEVYDNYYPAIDGERIIWVQVEGCCNSDILLYNLSDGSLTAVTDNDGAAYEYYPDISGDWVIWHQGIYPEWDILAHNLVTDETLTLTDHPFLQMSAHLDGNLVVWKDIVVPYHDADIIGYDLETRQTFTVADGPAWQDQPYVHNGLITWMQQWDETLDHNQIWGLDYATGERFVIYDECQPFDYACPLLGFDAGIVSYGDLVVWIEDNSANNQLILTLRGARRLTQHTFMPLVRR